VGNVIMIVLSEEHGYQHRLNNCMYALYTK